jgi:hypothetical protein
MMRQRSFGLAYSQFLRLPHGIPSHDTFGRVFARLDPQAFQQCFLSWIRPLSSQEREADALGS